MGCVQLRHGQGACVSLDHTGRPGPRSSVQGPCSVLKHRVASLTWCSVDDGVAQPHSRTFVLSIPPSRPLVSHSRGVGLAPTGSQEPWGPMPPSSELKERKLATARTRTLQQAPQIRVSVPFSGELVVKIHQHALARSA